MLRGRSPANNGESAVGARHHAPPAGSGGSGKRGSAAQQRLIFQLLCAGLLLFFCYAMLSNWFLPCRGDDCRPGEASSTRAVHAGGSSSGGGSGGSRAGASGGSGAQGTDDAAGRAAGRELQGGGGDSGGGGAAGEQAMAFAGQQLQQASERAAQVGGGGGSAVDTAIQAEDKEMQDLREQYQRQLQEDNDDDDGDGEDNAHQQQQQQQRHGVEGVAASAGGASAGGGSEAQPTVNGDSHDAGDAADSHHHRLTFEAAKAGIRLGGASYEGPPPPVRQVPTASKPYIAPAERDDSVRCRQSGICDGQYECELGDRLACVREPSERQARVRDATLWAWKAYHEKCWGHDELKPLSGSCDKWFNMSLTLVDGLDTLMLMGLGPQMQDARAWIAQNMSSEQDDNHISVFETTIRVLGGLLSAFHLSGGDKLYLYRALELGLRLLPGFGSKTGIPYSDINLKTHHASPPHWSPHSSLSEVGTLDVEFSYLARVAGRPELEAPALDAMQSVLALAQTRNVGPLLPMYVDPNRARFKSKTITLGARTDSYYEYLLKEWLVTGKRHGWLLRAYHEAMADVRSQLLRRTSAHGLAYLAEVEEHGETSPKMDHLVCFMPGLFALGWLHGLHTGSPDDPSDLEVAEQLAATCYEMYHQTPTGLASEIVFFLGDPSDSAGFPKQHVADIGNGDFVIKPADSHNLLRPETVESLFILWRVTRKQKYREWGWSIFRAFERHTRLDGGGYACLSSVTELPARRRDKMESFFLAETLKYLYLLFDDTPGDLMPLTQYVFNTEAHPIPMQGSPADAAMAPHHLVEGWRQWRWRSLNSSMADLDADLQVMANELLAFSSTAKPDAAVQEAR